jgi:ATP-dependent Clp protease ATP-binding subunit ClpC
VSTLELEKVRRLTHGQGIELSFDRSIIDYLSQEGYRPEYGARELRRLIQSKVEIFWQKRCFQVRSRKEAK